MNLQSLKPAKDFACNYGVKSIIYGPPGSKKTPTINTCPRPVLIHCEPGMLSMRGSTVPTFQAFTAKLIDEFFDWFFNSNEAKGFDTLAIDSASEMCEIYLEQAKKDNKHGLAAYGQMAESVTKQLNKLYFTQYKHTYIVAKQEIVILNGMSLKRPYYPGQQLPVQMPHKYDQVLHLDIQNVPSQGQVSAFRCVGSIDVMARDRTGMLAEFEPPDFNYIVKKAMS